MSFQRLPISEQVDQNMLSTLQAISPADERFQIQLKNVRFPDVAGNTSPADMNCVIHVADDTEDADENTPSNFKQWRRVYAIQIFIMKSPEDLAAIRFETWANVIRADVEQAIVADPYRGGTAENTELHDPVTFADAGDVQGIFVFCSVIYRTLYENPYSKK